LKKAEELAEQNLYLMPPNANEESKSVDSIPDVDLEEPMNAANSSDIAPGLIARLCAKQSHFHTDEVGQVRFFGPTSSLHTTEKVSSTFVQWDDGTIKIDAIDLQDISPLLRDHLLEQYWNCKLHSPNEVGGVPQSRIWHGPRKNQKQMPDFIDLRHCL
jgi:hypothetical protein